MITNLSLGRYGRLGNQIFQYAMLKAISVRNNQEIVLPIENIENYTVGRYNPSIGKKDIYKMDLFDCFKIKTKTMKTEEIKKYVTRNFSERQMHHDENVFNQSDGTNFHGYFQNATYFYEAEKEIREELAFNDEVNDFCEMYMNKIKKLRNVNKITTVHVRRGDGVMDKGKFQILLKPEYFNKLIEKHRSENNIFFFISDDIKWCKENFHSKDFIFSKTNSAPVSAASHILDFCLLSKGDTIFMSNSSFSWWAAWLSKTSDIYCPNKWWGYENSHFKEDNLRHKDWNLVEV
jgi:hypothetical protein|tara:strand:+ start:1303 stop:2175 length:873 start_codon:yes stop_codon:yes gene_type:complete